MVSLANLRPLYLLLPILTAIVVNSIYPGEVFHHSKYCLILCSFLTFLLLLLHRSRFGWSSREAHQFLGGSLLFFLFSGPSIIVSVNRTRSLDVFFLFLAYGLILIVFLWVRLSVNEILLIMTMLSLIAGIVDLVALFQHFTGLKDLRQTVQEALSLDPEFRSRLLGRINSRRVFASFPLPNTLAGFLATLVPIQAYLVYFSSQQVIKKTSFSLFGVFNSWRNWYAPIACSSVLLSLSLWVLALTQSFGGWVCFIGSAMAAGCLFVWLGNFNWHKWFLVALPCVLVFLVSWILWISQQRGFGLMAFSAPTNPIVLRSINYRTALAIFRDFPWTGVGLGNYGTINPRYQLSLLTVTQFAHNTPLQLIAEAGFSGLMALLFVLGYAARKSWHIIPDIKGFNKSQRLLVIALLASLGAWGIHNLIDINLYFPSVGGLGILILGLFLSQTFGGKAQTLTKVLPLSVSRVLLGGMALAFCWISWIVARQYVAETMLQMAVASVQSNDLAQAKHEINRSLFFNPNNPTTIVLEARIQLEEGIRQQHISSQLLESVRISYEKANALDPYNAENYYELGRVLTAIGETEGATHARLRAQQLFPSETRYQKPYGVIKRN